jgi:receptor protein-tyrosine kinase
MDEVVKAYDVVVLDTPAATSGNDAYSIAHRARGALIVARKDKSRFDVVQRITEHFRGDGVEVLGAVLNEL